MIRKLNKIFDKSEVMEINDKSKIVIMSDCHRGDGNNYDDFLKNKNIFNAALKYYYKNGFTYMELGDGDEMWEVKEYGDIIDIHLDTFKILKEFYDKKRLIMFYGNHDIEKKNEKILKKYFYGYYDEVNKEHKELFDDLMVNEALILKYNDKEIFLLHGHQVDFLNGTIWGVAKFLVRYLLRPMEYIGLNDLTSAAKNYKNAKLVDSQLQNWSVLNNVIVIAGHTHRPIFPEVGKSLYFNDGSCIHPNGITCLEIENGSISLVRWSLNVADDGSIYTQRTPLTSKEKIDNFFK